MKRESPAVAQAADECDSHAAGVQPTVVATASMRRDLPLMYGAQALRYLAPMILVPFYGRILGIESYGHLLSAMALMQIVWLFIEWGLPSTGFRDMAAAVNLHQRGRLLATQLAARVLLALFVVPPALVALFLTPALKADRVVSGLALALGVASAFNMTWFFQGIGRFRLAAVFEVLSLGVSTAIILASVRGPGDAWIIPGALFAVGACSSLLQVWLAASPAPRGSIVFNNPWRAIRNSTLLFVDRGQTMMLGPLCVFLVGFVAPVPAVAAFAVADRLMGVALVLLNPLNQVFAGRLTHSVAKMQQGGNEDATYRLMRRFCGFSMGYYALVAIAGFMLAHILIPLIFGPGYLQVVPVFRVLCVALVCSGAASVLMGNVLYPLRHDKDTAVLSTIRLLTTCAGVTLLAALAGAMGAAAGRLVGAALTFGALVFIFRQRSLWPIFFRRLRVAA